MPERSRDAGGKLLVYPAHHDAIQQDREALGVRLVWSSIDWRDPWGMTDGVITSGCRSKIGQSVRMAAPSLQTPSDLVPEAEWPLSVSIPPCHLSPQTFRSATSSFPSLLLQPDTLSTSLYSPSFLAFPTLGHFNHWWQRQFLSL